MRILVTGGCGFIGSHFVRRLVAGGDDVVVLDKLTYSGRRENLDAVECELHVGDIADPEAVERAAAGCDAIVNFAAETHVDRSILEAGDFISTDVYGTHVLLERAREAGLRFLQVSTDEVYGDVPPGVSSTEADPLRPSSPYSASKAASDHLVRAWARTFKLNVKITNCSNNYGPLQFPEKLIPLMISNIVERKPLPVYGDGLQRREWLHAEDHCAAVELVLREGEPGGVYNVGGEERENLDVIERIVDLTGADPALVRHVDDRPGHDRRYSVDSARVRALGWEPRHELEAGLAETVGWYRENRAWWGPIKSGEYLDYYKRQYAERLG